MTQMGACSIDAHATTYRGSLHPYVLSVSLGASPQYLTPRVDERHIRKGFGARLRHIRTAADLSQDRLAERAGLSTQAVAAFEQGERFPRAETLASLATALGVEVAAFFDLADRVAEPSGAPRKARGGERAKLLSEIQGMLERASLPRLRLLRRILPPILDEE